jgi:predicted transcriptional regulator of viral defense system
MEQRTPLPATFRLFTTEDVDRYLQRLDDRSRRSRDRLRASLCSAGVLVRVRRGLYATAAADGATPDAYQLAAWLAPDAILGVGTALEMRGVVPSTGRRCIYFTRLATGGPGPVWHGASLHPVSHPTALLRNGGPFVETELIGRNGSGSVRVATTERAFVDILERPRLTGTWSDVLRIVGQISVLDLDRVVAYLERLDNATTAAKVGWMLERHQEQFGVTTPVLGRIERLRPRGPHYLSRTRRESGRFIGRWNLVVPRAM